MTKPFKPGTTVRVTEGGKIYPNGNRAVSSRDIEAGHVGVVTREDDSPEVAAAIGPWVFMQLWLYPGEEFLIKCSQLEKVT